MYYINIFDLLFNGAEDCKMETEPCEAPYITIERRYNIPLGCDTYTARYKNVKLGENRELISIGFLNAIIPSLKGKGEWTGWSLARGNAYRPFIRKERQKIKSLGIWSF